MVRRAAGFTVVEVIAALAAAAVLALTMGAVLFHMWRGWRANKAYSEMQRDGIVALRAIDRAVREGSPNRVSVVVDRLHVLTTNGLRRSFYAQGASLMYNPDQDGGGVAIALASNRLATNGFICALGSARNVNVKMILSESGISTDFRFSVRMRNYP